MPLTTKTLSFEAKSQAEINKIIMTELKDQQVLIQILFNRLDGKNSNADGYNGPSVYRKYEVEG